LVSVVASILASRTSIIFSFVSIVGRYSILTSSAKLFAQSNINQSNPTSGTSCHVVECDCNYLSNSMELRTTWVATNSVATW
jgi:hypothetical protein